MTQDYQRLSVPSINDAYLKRVKAPMNFDYFASEKPSPLAKVQMFKNKEQGIIFKESR